MGAGKTTIGKYAAKQNGLQFLDLDAYIEQKLNMTIRDLFKDKGEDFFRVEERRALEEVCAISDIDLLISCGGGTPCFFDNMDLMNATGHTLYLDMSAARLTDRLRNAKNKRPLINSLQGDLQTFVHKKLMERAAQYALAQSIVPEKQCNKKDVGVLIKALISAQAN